MKTRSLALCLLWAACDGGTETVEPALGSLQITVSATGRDIDRDGVVVSVDSVAVVIPANGEYMFEGLAAGVHTAVLSDVGANCTSDAPLERDVQVEGGTNRIFGWSLTCTLAPLTNSNLIAFARADSDHTWDLWVMNGVGTGETKLRDSPNVTEFQPAWTPDGQHILFTSYNIGTGAATLARIDRVGAGFSGFVSLATSAFSPSVSADGARVVFAKDSGGYDIWVMNINGTNQQQLTTDPAYEDHPSWSPDGTQIVFERGYRLYVMNADGTNPHSISAPDAVEDRWPAWSPDASRILFIRRGFGQDHVHTIRPDGTGLTPLTFGLDNDDFPAWSGDGARILFSSGRGGMLSIWSMRSDGMDMRRLSIGPPTPYDSYPAWSR